MSINLITGYDINCDERGYVTKTTSKFAPRSLFAQHIEKLRSNTIHFPIPLVDDSNTEWLYNQKEEII